MIRKLLLGLIIVFTAISLASCASKRGPKASGDLTVNDQAQTYGLDESAQDYGNGLNQTGSYANAEASNVLPAICTPSAEQAQTPGVGQHYFFAFNMSELNPQAIQSLKIQAQYLVSNPSSKVRITGNTDDRGSREYNVALGWRRAAAVANFLMQYGVNKNQITTVSYGAEKPAAFGMTEAAYQCNRRVDLAFQG